MRGGAELASTPSTSTPESLSMSTAVCFGSLLSRPASRNEAKAFFGPETMCSDLKVTPLAELATLALARFSEMISSRRHSTSRAVRLISAACMLLVSLQRQRVELELAVEDRDERAVAHGRSRRRRHFEVQ